jgi:hypothetical protein
VGIVTGIIENTSDEKPGEDKEDVDACPAPRDGVIVLKKHQKEGDGSEAVKRRIKDAVLGNCAFDNARNGPDDGHQ